MTRAVCTVCRKTGRLLEGPTHPLVDFYACDTCGHIWARDKNNPDAPERDVMPPAPTFRVVQPWGPDEGRQNTVLSEHATIREAFDAADGFAAQVAGTGAR